MFRTLSSCAGLMLAIGLVVSQVAFADVIHLKNGGRIEVDAWRDEGNAIEFARGGGIVRISKAEVRKIDGTPTRATLLMYSAPASARATTPGPDPKAVAERMTGLLTESDQVFDRGVLEPDEKVNALRRLAGQWRALDVPEPMREVYQRGEQAILMAVEAFTAEDAGVEAREQIAAARKEIADAREAIGEAVGGEG